jgi:hypothetical protein
MNAKLGGSETDGGNSRVNYSAVAHCDRLIAAAREQLRANV